MFEQEGKENLDREVSFSYHSGRLSAFYDLAEYFRKESGNAYSVNQDGLALEYRRLRLKMMDSIAIEEKEKVKFEKPFSGGV